MKINSFTAALAATLLVATQCFGQGPGPSYYGQGPGPMGPGAMGPGAMGPGAMGPGAMGPMGPGAVPPGYGVPPNYAGPVAGYGVPAGYGGQPMGYADQAGYGAPQGYGPPPGYGGVAPAGYGGPMPQGAEGEYGPQSPSEYCGEDCDCDLCACQRCPHWYIAADALWLRIRETGSTVMAVDQNLATNDPNYAVLRTSDISSGFVAGPRITLGYPMGCYGAGELTYWGLHHFSKGAFVRGNNNLSLPPDLGPATDGFFDADYIDISRVTELHNAEANYFAPETCAGFSWLSGIRYMNIQDRIGMLAIDPDNVDPISTLQWKTETNMIGPQLGLRLRRNVLCNWRIEGLGKAGLMGVSSWQRTTLDDAGVITSTFNRTSNIGTVCEGQINAVRWITDNWGLRFGYDVFYLAGIATARKQVDFNFAPGPQQRVGHADMFLYGYHVGTEVRW
jgi:hypothetical protein